MIAVDRPYVPPTYREIVPHDLVLSIASPFEGACALLESMRRLAEADAAFGRSPGIRAAAQDYFAELLVGRPEQLARMRKAWPANGPAPKRRKRKRGYHRALAEVRDTWPPCPDCGAAPISRGRRRNVVGEIVQLLSCTACHRSYRCVVDHEGKALEEA